MLDFLRDNAWTGIVSIITILGLLVGAAKFDTGDIFVFVIISLAIVIDVFIAAVLQFIFQKSFEAGILFAVGSWTWKQMDMSILFAAGVGLRDGLKKREGKNS